MKASGISLQIKVLVYLVSHGRILTFVHYDYPEAGLQVPGGTVEEGESIVACAKRELLEESGLRTNAEHVVFNEYSFFPAWDAGVVHHRHLVAIVDDEIVTDEFYYTIPGGSNDSGLRLKYLWCDYATLLRDVGSGHALGIHWLERTIGMSYLTGVSTTTSTVRV